MLVLSRKIGEEIMIGDSIRLVVVGVRGTQVRLGLEAPQNVAIHRREVHSRIAERDDADLFGAKVQNEGVAQPVTA